MHNYIAWNRADVTQAIICIILVYYNDVGLSVSEIVFGN